MLESDYEKIYDTDTKNFFIVLTNDNKSNLMRVSDDLSMGKALGSLFLFYFPCGAFPFLNKRSGVLAHCAFW